MITSHRACLRKQNHSFSPSSSIEPSSRRSGGLSLQAEKLSKWDQKTLQKISTENLPHKSHKQPSKLLARPRTIAIIRRLRKVIEKLWEGGRKVSDFHRANFTHSQPEPCHTMCRGTQQLPTQLKSHYSHSLVRLCHCRCCCRPASPPISIFTLLVILWCAENKISPFLACACHFFRDSWFTLRASAVVRCLFSDESVKINVENVIFRETRGESESWKTFETFTPKVQSYQRKLCHRQSANSSQNSPK